MIEESLFDSIVSLIEGDTDCERKAIKIPVIKDYNMHSIERIVYTKRYDSRKLDTEISFMFPNPDTIVARVLIKKLQWKSILWPSIDNQWYLQDISIDFVARRNDNDDKELQNIAHACNAFFDFNGIPYLYEMVARQQNKNLLITKLPPVFAN